MSVCLSAYLSVCMYVCIIFFFSLLVSVSINCSQSRFHLCIGACLCFRLCLCLSVCVCVSLCASASLFHRQHSRTCPQLFPRQRIYIHACAFTNPYSDTCYIMQLRLRYERTRHVLSAKRAITTPLVFSPSIASTLDHIESILLL